VKAGFLRAAEIAIRSPNSGPQISWDGRRTSPERHQAGTMSDGQQEETLADLEAIENAYAQGGPPSLVDCTVLAALNGRFDDVAEVARDSALTLNAMPYRQEAALAETWLCSPVRAVPHLHDLPSHSVAYFGLPSLSTVGDEDGALLGFTEMDAVGRTARSLRVLPVLYTQKRTDPLRAGLAGYISRILVLPIEDEAEARAACALARLEATPDGIRRITGKARTGNAPNWDSMRALREYKLYSAGIAPAARSAS
jgi:hypothetical protein